MTQVTLTINKPNMAEVRVAARGFAARAKVAIKKVDTMSISEVRGEAVKAAKGLATKFMNKFNINVNRK